MVGGLAGMGIACGEAEDIFEFVNVIGGREWDAEEVSVRLLAEAEGEEELVEDARRRCDSWIRGLLLL